MADEQRATVEERRLTAGPLEVRATENEPTRLTGYAAVFNTRTAIGDVSSWGFYEEIAPGAFRNALAMDVRALLNHSPDHVLGRTTNGTLTLAEDDKGLRVEITPPDTQTGRDVLALVKRGDISQMSFAFRTVKDTWREEKGKAPVRTLEEVELYDVSPVTYPAYPTTSISARTKAEALHVVAEVEAMQAQGDGGASALLAHLALDEVA
jgi:uncharacterized protein